MEKLIVDIDNTLLSSPYVNNVYMGATPIDEEIKALNELYMKGYIVILWTGRGWHHYENTVKQLEKCGIKYHELIMGKPTGIYIDRDNKRSCLELL
jgi:hydroxymethylpyrimidine pyrophosphatase-like HAD family hydrolase